MIKRMRSRNKFLFVLSMAILFSCVTPVTVRADIFSIKVLRNLPLFSLFVGNKKNSNKFRLSFLRKFSWRKKAKKQQAVYSKFSGLAAKLAKIPVAACSLVRKGAKNASPPMIFAAKMFSGGILVCAGIGALFFAAWKLFLKKQLKKKKDKLKQEFEAEKKKVEDSLQEKIKEVTEDLLSDVKKMRGETLKSVRGELDKRTQQIKKIVGDVKQDLDKRFKQVVEEKDKIVKQGGELLDKTKKIKDETFEKIDEKFKQILQEKDKIVKQGGELLDKTKKLKDEAFEKVDKSFGQIIKEKDRMFEQGEKFIEKSKQFLQEELPEAIKNNASMLVGSAAKYPFKKAGQGIAYPFKKVGQGGVSLCSKFFVPKEKDPEASTSEDIEEEHVVPIISIESKDKVQDEDRDVRIIFDSEVVPKRNFELERKREKAEKERRRKLRELEMLKKQQKREKLKLEREKDKKQDHITDPFKVPLIEGEKKVFIEDTIFTVKDTKKEEEKKSKSKSNSKKLLELLGKDDLEALD